MTASAEAMDRMLDVAARPRRSPVTNVFGETRKPVPPLGSVVGRLMRCTRCGSDVDVLEAVLGARRLVDHQFLDPATYACGDCLVSGDLERRP